MTLSRQRILPAFFMVHRCPKQREMSIAVQMKKTRIVLIVTLSFMINPFKKTIKLNKCAIAITYFTQCNIGPKHGLQFNCFYNTFESYLKPKFCFVHVIEKSVINAARLLAKA